MLYLIRPGDVAGGCVFTETLFFTGPCEEDLGSGVAARTGGLGAPGTGLATERGGAVGAAVLGAVVLGVWGLGVITAGLCWSVAGS